MSNFIEAICPVANLEFCPICNNQIVKSGPRLCCNEFGSCYRQYNSYGIWLTIDSFDVYYFLQKNCIKVYFGNDLNYISFNWMSIEDLKKLLPLLDFFS